MKWYWFSIIIITLFLLLTGGPAQAQKSGKAIYEGRCAACHKISNQDLVGPGLANVNKRREQEWLIKFIKNSQKLIQGGDELANKLYNQYNQNIMPSHADLSDEDIVGVLDYIKQESEGVEAQKVLTDQQAKSDAGKSEKKSEFSALPQGDVKKDYAYDPDSTKFQMLFWMGAIIVILAVLGFTLIVIKFSS